MKTAKKIKVGNKEIKIYKAKAAQGKLTIKRANARPS